MPNEIELKFCVSVPSLAHLMQRWLPTQAAVKTSRHHLANTYFDTPDLALNRLKVALRLRDQEGQTIQTLKTKGVSVGGLHQRGEWEWQVEESRLYPELLQGTAFPSDVKVSELAPLFHTDFERTAVVLQVGESLVEVAFDQGVISAGPNSVPIAEVELELKQGSVDSLFKLAVEIAREVPVWLSDVSKAERGYRLGAKAAPAVPSRKPVEHLTLDERVKDCRLDLYRIWLRGLEEFRAQPGFQALLHLHAVLFALETVSSTVPPEVGFDGQSELLDAMGPVLAWLAQLLEESASQGLMAILERFEAAKEPGLLSLQFSKLFAAGR